jgi:hypothetical protein
MAMVLLDVSCGNLKLPSPSNTVSNVPIGAFALAMVLLLVKPQQSSPTRALPVRERLKRMDWIGTLIFLSAFVCLFLALQWGGQTKPWNSSEVIGLFVGFGLLLALFALTQYFMGDDSLIPPRILKQRTVLFGTVYLILFGLQMAVVSISDPREAENTKVADIAKYLQYIPIYFQAIRGTSALNSGIRMIALDAARVVFIIISGVLVTQFGHYVSIHITHLFPTPIDLPVPRCLTWLSGRSSVWSLPGF